MVSLSSLLPFWGIVILGIIYLGVILTIILENRNPSKTVAYLLALVFLPLIGLIVFYFFGRDFRKKKIFKLKGGDDEKLLRQYPSIAIFTQLAIHQ